MTLEVPLGLLQSGKSLAAIENIAYDYKGRVRLIFH